MLLGFIDCIKRHGRHFDKDILDAIFALNVSNGSLNILFRGKLDHLHIVNSNSSGRNT